MPFASLCFSEEISNLLGDAQLDLLLLTHPSNAELLLLLSFDHLLQSIDLLTLPEQHTLLFGDLTSLFGEIALLSSNCLAEARARRTSVINTLNRNHRFSNLMCPKCWDIDCLMDASHAVVPIISTFMDFKDSQNTTQNTNVVEAVSSIIARECGIRVFGLPSAFEKLTNLDLTRQT